MGAVKDAITPNAPLDQAAYTVYDNAGRALYAFNGKGELSQNTYDAYGNVTQARRLADARTVEVRF